MCSRSPRWWLLRAPACSQTSAYARGAAAMIAEEFWRSGALPAVVREGLVGLRHAEDVVLALVGAALLGLRVEQLAGQARGHLLLATAARELDQPAHRQRAGAAARDLDRHLVGGAADAA